MSSLRKQRFPKLGGIPATFNTWGILKRLNFNPRELGTISGQKLFFHQLLKGGVYVEKRGLNPRVLGKTPGTPLLRGLNPRGDPLNGPPQMGEIPRGASHMWQL